ncbi:MAG: NAD-glutamate dehydrogenase [Legionella sp.]|nr:NAD-glutamate dehydrogenase [Legionella sp.]
MSYKFEEGKDVIIDAVVKRLKQRMKGEQASLCAKFVRQFYVTVALEDLTEWGIEDLYGAAVNFWSLIQKRAPDETKIRIYNPDLERHGWQTTHTVVEIITEDKPFLVDSLRMVINRLGIMSHLIMHMGNLHLKRDKDDQVIDVLPRPVGKQEGVVNEAAIFMEVDRQTDAAILEDLHRNFERVLEENRVVVKDWEAMREGVREAITQLDEVAAALDPDELAETKAFLSWIENHHFTFLGMRDYKLIQKDDETVLQPLPETGLGVLRQSMSKSTERSISAMSPEARALTLSTRILVMSKTNTEATVHRSAYTDYIGIKRFDKQGKVIGERRIIGLYTSAAYNTSPKYIPFLRHKVSLIMQNSNLNPRGHAGKVLLNILETLPRDDLIQATEEELLEIAMGIYYMQERRRIRMFARTDVYRRFVSCLVFVPKERFSTELRLSMERILAEYFNSNDISYATLFSEASVLARIHFIIRTDPQDLTEWDFKSVEQKLIEVGRTWEDELKDFLLDTFGEEQANELYSRYKGSFPSAYKENFSPRIAVYDIKHVEALSAENPLVMNFYKMMDEKPENFRLKIYQNESSIALTDVLPLLEKLGMRALSERPYSLKNGRDTSINDFALQYTRPVPFEIDKIRELFQNAFSHVWFGDAENDGFNQLVLAAGLDWHQVSVLRMYAKYFKQIGLTFSQEYIEDALSNNAAVAKKIVQLFEIRFNPQLSTKRDEEYQKVLDEIYAALEGVTNLDEDKIIRQYMHVISSTLRTNYYQVTREGHAKNYLSIKLNSKAIPGIPKPYPLYEIFVYSPQFEGVHLRGGRVARGGLRWSDRREDFRTEILGLMKAQQVKNAVIVPSGAKGGFVLKQLPTQCSREETLLAAIQSYKLFIRGLLDITDNYHQGAIIKPQDTLSYDEDDPYLVVAADKGTATFSDIANEISLEYGFWLGDAFASGGSVGYDHKKMGITARGAWESVKRHFYELGQDIEENPFTVVGIGDMAGDVFGNGMLLSRQIKLVGAFNHLHIFIDPNPDPEVSFKERERLFHLPRSNWSDYDSQLISKGGGVFNRSAKAIPVSEEMKEAFGLTEPSIEPNELIRVLLTLNIDLLWSAGIGTFVKASTESHSDVGDRTNDAIRINAKQLMCKVVGEGGNLGFTQLARVEYAFKGGMIYTDFIDNSAGVNCSDKEVNIKILLNHIVASGDMTEKQRNELLSEMTPDVATLVIQDNFNQPRAISLAAMQSAASVELHSRYINELERSGKLDRELEFLPSESSLMELKLQGKGLTRPGIAVLLCYTKTLLKEQILASDLPEDTYLKDALVSYFPKQLQERFRPQMQEHPLKREIIATKLSNLIVNEMGFTFVYRLQDETGASIPAIVQAYVTARSVLDLEDIWTNMSLMGNQVTAKKQNELTTLYLRLLRRMTRWFLRNQRLGLTISKAVKHYREGVRAFKESLPKVLDERSRKQYEIHYRDYVDLGIPAQLAHELTITRALFPVLDVIAVSHETKIEVQKVAEVYFWIEGFLEMSWIRTQVISHPTETHWEALSREGLRDDLDWQQRLLAAGILSICPPDKEFSSCFGLWVEKNKALIARWRHMLSDLRASTTLNYTMFFVAIRELLDLTQTTVQMSSK